MIHNEELNPLAPPSPFTGRVKRWGDDLVAFEIGGVAIADASLGNNYQQWYGRVVDGAIQLSNDEQVWTTVLTRPGEITEMDFSFDQSMTPFIVWVEDGQTRIYWFDPNIPGTTVTNFGNTWVSPRCCMDDKRPLQIGNSDVILTYIRNNNLYYRQQRDRYSIERLLASGLDPEQRLVAVSMSAGLRLQWKSVP